MQAEVVRRRINMISAHFAPNDDVLVNPVLPMNCSGSLNSVFQRRDNKVYFARQASASLGSFMRPTAAEEFFQGGYIGPKYGRVASESHSDAREPCYARPARTEPNFSDAREPCYARPARTESCFSNGSVIQPMAQSCNFIAPEAPAFARPGSRIVDDQLQSEEKISDSKVGGTGWSPRMDVAESEGKYVLTVEIPGVSTNDITVKVDDQKLSVRGRRSTSYWRVAGYSNAPVSSYHKREILYGPYEVVWPLPVGVNGDSVSAVFLDGLLQIIIPKL